MVVCGLVVVVFRSVSDCFVVFVALCCNLHNCFLLLFSAFAKLIIFINLTHNSNNESNILELPPNVDASLDQLASRDREFVRGRALREGAPLSTAAYVMGWIQFSVTLAVAVVLMEQHDYLLRGAVENVVKIVASASAMCVLSLQTIKFYY